MTPVSGVGIRASNGGSFSSTRAEASSASPCSGSRRALPAATPVTAPAPDAAARGAGCPGDALTNTIDGLADPNPVFTEDAAAAAESVRKLAALEPQVILVGSLS